MRWSGKTRIASARPRRRTAGGRVCETLEPRLLLAVDVLTYHNDNMRTGANLNETVLTPANVNITDFGKVGQVAVDGAVYAQPLIKTGVAIPGRGTHNVVYVATEHDSVYAFDADTLAPLWHDGFINPAAGVTTVSAADLKNTDVGAEVGITSTPVIDPSTGTMYVVAFTKEVSGASVQFVQRLHALDSATGAEKFGGPVAIQATVPGKGTGSVRGRVSFVARWANQRAALLLDNGVVDIAWASFGDGGPFHGWIMGYNAQTLQQTAAFNVTPNGSQGGIWMSGGGLSADANHHLYVATGNGTLSPAKRGGNYGDAVLKLTPGNLSVADFFAPYNQKVLSRGDLDLGSGGVLLLPDQPGPHPHLLVTGGKEGRLYLLDRDKLGGYNPGKDHVLQELPKALNSVFDTAAVFNGALYFVGAPVVGAKTVQGARDVLKAFSLGNGLLAPTPATGAATYGYPGSTPSISAAGTANGIVWTLDNGTAGPAVLRASDAGNVSHELFNSNQAGTRDPAGAGVKFTVPTVANGKVYVGGRNTLTVYGLLSSPSPT